MSRRERFKRKGGRAEQIGVSGLGRLTTKMSLITAINGWWPQRHPRWDNWAPAKTGSKKAAEITRGKLAPVKRDVILFCWDIQYLGDVSGPCFDLIPILEDESWPLRPDLQLESHLWSRDRHSCVSSAGQMWKHVLPSLSVRNSRLAFPCLDPQRYFCGSF